MCFVFHHSVLQCFVHRSDRFWCKTIHVDSKFGCVGDFLCDDSVRVVQILFSCFSLYASATFLPNHFFGPKPLFSAHFGNGCGGFAALRVPSAAVSAVDSAEFDDPLHFNFASAFVDAQQHSFGLQLNRNVRLRGSENALWESPKTDFGEHRHSALALRLCHSEFGVGDGFPLFPLCPFADTVGSQTESVTNSERIRQNVFGHSQQSS